MGLFGLGSKKNEGGLMDAIRCDEKDFLIWKWRPVGQTVNTTRKENAIRYGSSISVRPGQAAVLLYQQKEGEYDVIKGPYNDIIKTENLPILASIIGLAYSGGTPFQAELYYINLAKGMEIPFTIPYFRVVPAEQEYKAYDVQVAIKGTLTFEASCDKECIKYMFESWSGSDTTLDELKEKLTSILTQEIKQIVANAPKDTGIFVMHFNSLIGELGQYILARVQNKIMHRFGIIPTDVTISDIRYDDESESYIRLKAITEDRAFTIDMENEKNALLSYTIQRETMRTDADVRNESVKQMAQIQLENQADMMARMRDESQFAQHQQTMIASQQAGLMNQAAANRAAMASEAAMHRSNLASESAFIGAHQINVQADVMKTGLENMGEMSAMNLGGDGHMNPAGMMTSMMMGTAVAGQMGNMMNNMGNTIHNNMQGVNSQNPMPPAPPISPSAPVPPPPPSQQNIMFTLFMNNQQYGPFDLNTLKQYAQTGQITPDTMAWCEGMPAWTPIKNIPALGMLFPQSTLNGSCPPPPPVS